MLDANSAMAPSFDFRSYLLDLTGEEWIIEELEGGNANHTVRATRKISANGSHLGGDATYDTHRARGNAYLSSHQSVVLKQAPPYLAKCTSIPFSQYRQVSS